ncbi:MAG: DUF378 domain-containing protein [Gammaproteobacteria bacterium]|nr:DUF378 domain-containing protein [Gammaproteobacteria bacterium]MCH9744611.1 DUF378 domain-containing protein [Gammaproteobacteria bacterium]
MKNKNALDHICFILIIFGAITWGLIGIFKFNLIVAIFGASPALVHAIYIIVGLAALVALVQYARCKGK